MYATFPKVLYVDHARSLFIHWMIFKLMILKEYPVTVCSSDEVTYKEGEFIISNTQPSYSVGEHWVVLYFGKEEPDEFFDSLGNWQEHYSIIFETALNKPYLLTLNQFKPSSKIFY